MLNAEKVTVQTQNAQSEAEEKYELSYEAIAVGYETKLLLLLEEYFDKNNDLNNLYKDYICTTIRIEHNLCARQLECHVRNVKNLNLRINNALIKAKQDKDDSIRALDILWERKSLICRD